jgi:hypothetical protein
LDLIGSGTRVVDADREAEAAAVDRLGKLWVGITKKVEANSP